MGAFFAGHLTAILRLLSALAFVFFILFVKTRKKGRLKALFKCVPGFLALTVALLGILFEIPADSGRLPAWFIVAGLALCVAADWALEFDFIKGAALFGAAHCLFISAFYLKGGLNIYNALCFALLCGVTGVLFCVFRHKKSARLPFAALAAYAGVLSLMAALAFGCGASIAAGAVLFVLSDALLCLRLFGAKLPRGADYVLMGTYYAALFLFAFGAFVI